jgi:hypothetical protein
MNAVTVQTPMMLLDRAVETGADVDKLEKLMSLQERWQVQESRRQFAAAMAAFQSECPPIPKSKEVKNRDGTPRYKYAPLDTIIKTLREPLRTHGFSWRFDTAHLEETLQVTCTLSHMGGHSESATVTIPSVTGHGTNAAQDEGSGMTYGKRYAFANVTGITIDEDDDGASAGPENSLQLIRHNEAVRTLLPSILCIKENLREGGDLSAAAEAYAEFTRREVEALWVAPTKGGIWTVEERKTIKSGAEFHRLVHSFREAADWHANPENQA